MKNSTHWLLWTSTLVYSLSTAAHSGSLISVRGMKKAPLRVHACE